MSDLLSTSVSGLLAFQRALDVTSNNVANAATPGYSRENVNFSERQAQASASGYIGNIVAGLAAIMVRNVSTLAKNLQLFVRVGGYTNHAYRGGVTLAAGLDIYYELLKR